MWHISCFLATTAMWKRGWKKKDNCKKGVALHVKKTFLKIMNEKIYLDAYIDSLPLQVFILTHSLIPRFRVKTTTSWLFGAMFI